MNKVYNKEIKYTDQALRLNAGESSGLIKSLSIPTMAIIGAEDYVGSPPIEKTVTVKGGHVSPLEAPEEVTNWISRLTKLIPENLPAH